MAYVSSLQLEELKHRGSLMAELSLGHTFWILQRRVQVYKGVRGNIGYLTTETLHLANNLSSVGI